jgi:hypothetical protein
MRCCAILVLATVLCSGESITQRLADAEIAREQGPYEVQKASFPIDIDVPEAVDPRVMCWVAMPTKNGKPAPRARTAVALFHTPGAKDLGGTLERIAATSGFTVFGCIFPSSGTYGYRDRKRFYGFAASGSFASTAKAFERLRTAQKLLPRFFVYGYSAGGIMSQRFAEEYPELMLGVASMCGHTFVQKRGATCPFLIMHTLGDFGVGQGDNLARYYVSQGVPVIRAVLDTNWDLRKQDNQHATHAQADAAVVLAMRFFEGIDDLRAKAGGEAAPPRDSWPLVCSSADPRQVSNRSIAAVGAITKTGDTPVYLPSGRMHQALLDIPPVPRRQVIGEREWLVSMPAPDIRPTSVWVSLQPLTEELLISQADTGQPIDDALLQGDLRYAASRGSIAIGTHGSRGDLRLILKDALNSTPGTAALPLHVQLVDPRPDGFDQICQTPRLASMSLVFTESFDLSIWRKPLASLGAVRCQIGLLANQEIPPGAPPGVFVLHPAGTLSWFGSMGLHQHAVEWAVGLMSPRP